MTEIDSLPVLHVRANNNYDIGYTIGKTFKSRINEYCESSDDVRRYREFYNHDEGKNIVETYIQTGSKSHPNIMSEIRGMADGAGLKFDDIFLLQIASELDFCHIDEVMKADEETNTIPKGCTDLLLNRKEARVMGHNDDWTADVSERVYIVHVTINGNDGSIQEQFVSYCYPGYLPGFCFGMNSSLVITLNSLCPVEANRNSTPLLICLRSLLSCHSIDECLVSMENKSYGCAYGMNINIGSIKTADMCSMEVYPYKDKTQIHIENIPQESSPDNDCFYFHANNYKHMEAKEAKPWSGSRLRGRRVEEMSSPKCMDDVRTILGDTADDKEPIYRVPCPTHLEPEGKTSATAIFDISQRFLHVYRSNPKTATAPILTLPFFS